VEIRLAKLEKELLTFTIIESSPTTCDLWADIRYQRRKQPIENSDAWIAATAIACGTPLVTHNAKDFAGIPQLQLLTA
jgi:predicted nucleic acid-binding protein